ncbi:hypothetical protein BDV33DRAFT_183526 [Aspergillus novoparasiticus]|uniref:Amino acid permease/ SLC12A domain-containing protein n=1 Tax=Aspergillus novoparasiticus TaxID=986946 RepID=A0A5N6EAE5_9EURO|nr:hypothetical protein BDV33DRAFT_183526 [Aspergillus novoparasiticus]
MVPLAGLLWYVITVGIATYLAENSAPHTWRTWQGVSSRGNFASISKVSMDGWMDEVVG